MDEPIRTPVTPRELKITHRLQSFVCSGSGRQGEKKNPLFSISYVIDHFHISWLAKTQNWTTHEYSLLWSYIFRSVSSCMQQLLFFFISVLFGFSDNLSIFVWFTIIHFYKRNTVLHPLWLSRFYLLCVIFQVIYLDISYKTSFPRVPWWSKIPQSFLRVGCFIAPKKTTTKKDEATKGAPIISFLFSFTSLYPPFSPNVVGVFTFRIIT